MDAFIIPNRILEAFSRFFFLKAMILVTQFCNQPDILVSRPCQVCDLLQGLLKSLVLLDSLEFSNVHKSSDLDPKLVYSEVDDQSSNRSRCSKKHIELCTGVCLIHFYNR